MSKMSKVVTFAKEHKKELAIGAACVIGAGVIYCVTGRPTEFCLAKKKSTKDLPIPQIDLGGGRIVDFWAEKTGAAVTAEMIPLSKANEFLNAMADATPEGTEHIWCMTSFVLDK